MIKRNLKQMILNKSPEDILRKHINLEICLVGSQLDLILDLKNKKIDLEEYRNGLRKELGIKNE